MMENITYQMCTMTKEESAKALAGRVLHSSTIQLNLPFLTQKHTLHTPNIPYHPLNTPETSHDCTPCHA
jgi:hypothetical protein